MGEAAESGQCTRPWPRDPWFSSQCRQKLSLFQHSCRLEIPTLNESFFLYGHTGASGKFPNDAPGETLSHDSVGQFLHHTLLTAVLSWKYEEDFYP